MSGNVRSWKSVRPFDFVAKLIERDQALALTPAVTELDICGCSAIARRDLGQFTDKRMRAVDSRLGLGGARFWSASQPRDLRANAIFKRLLAALLRFEEGFFVFKKAAVVAACAQDAVGISGVDLRDLERNSLEEVAVMADGYGRERSIVQDALQPLNSFQVQMVRRFVQQKHIGRYGECARDGQPLAPAAGKGSGRYGEVLEAGTPQGFTNISIPLRCRHPRVTNSIFHHRPHGLPSLEVGNLRDVTRASTFAHRQFARIRLHFARQNL